MILFLLLGQQVVKLAERWTYLVFVVVLELCYLNKDNNNQLNTDVYNENIRLLFDDTNKNDW